MSFVRLCSKPFLAYCFHTAACAGNGNVYRGTVFCTPMLLVVRLCLTLLYDSSQDAILNTCWLRLTLDAEVEKDSVQDFFLNLFCDGVTHLFC